MGGGIEKTLRDITCPNNRHKSEGCPGGGRGRWGLFQINDFPGVGVGVGFV